MRSDDKRRVLLGLFSPILGMAFAVCVGLLATSLSSCALWQLGTPVKPKHLRPCVGTYSYPDSASVCADTTGGR